MENEPPSASHSEDGEPAGDVEEAPADEAQPEVVVIPSTLSLAQSWNWEEGRPRLATRHRPRPLYSPWAAVEEELTGFADAAGSFAKPSNSTSNPEQQKTRPTSHRRHTNLSLATSN